MARILIVLSDSTWLGRFLKPFEQMSIPGFCTRPTQSCLYPPPRLPSKAPEQSCCRPNLRDSARSCASRSGARTHPVVSGCEKIERRSESVSCFSRNATPAAGARGGRRRREFFHKQSALPITHRHSGNRYRKRPARAESGAKPSRLTPMNLLLGKSSRLSAWPSGSVATCSGARCSAPRRSVRGSTWRSAAGTGSRSCWPPPLSAGPSA
ncbi:hypothetical protein D3C85_703010 [compost metagenome]